jgi:hypothetical protein
VRERERERELSKKKSPFEDWVFKLLNFFKPYKFLKWGLVCAEECAKMDYWS